MGSLLRPRSLYPSLRPPLSIFLPMACPELHLVLCCVPCYGHAKPLIIFAEHLVDAGHQVTYLTSQKMVGTCEKICRDPRVRMLGVDDELQRESDDFKIGVPDKMKMHPVWYAEQKMTPVVVEAIKSMPRLPDMVISDHLTWAGPNAAHALGLKHTCHITWPLYMLEETGLLPLNSLARWVGVRVRNLLSSRFSPMCMKPAGPPRAMLERVRQNCLGSGERNLGGGLLLVTSSFGIESPRPLPPFVRVIGRGHRLETVDALAEHEELKAFLDGNSDVVYVTFGSRVPPPATLIRSVGDGLVAGGWAVVWSLQQQLQAHLPDAALASGRFFVRPWLPQGSALAHPNIRAAITHCGMGGLFECAANAIPLVPLPFSLSADQPVNARAAVAAGFAVRPRSSRSLMRWCSGGDPVFTADAIREAVDKAMHDPLLLEGARRAKRAVLAAGYGHGAVEAVESACLYGTDHLTMGMTKAGKASSSLFIMAAVAAGVAIGLMITDAAFPARLACAHRGSLWAMNRA